MRFFVFAAAVLAVVYLLVAAGMFVFQRSLIYGPDRTRRTPSEAGLSGVGEQILTAPDGARLVSWWARAEPGRPTIIYFHGNGGHLADRSERFRHFQTDGFGVLMLAYRSYSGSTGTPSETANVADGVMAYDFLAGKGLAARDIVLFGESLGTGVATQVAIARRSAGLVLDSPYTSLAEVAQWHYPWLPAAWLITDRYDIIGRIAAVHVPLLILHGEADQIVPVTMGRAVFAAANQPKRIFTYPGATHIHHTQFGSLDRVREFIGELND